MKARDIPNLICIVRILLVGPVVFLLIQGDFTEGLLLFAVAGASDGLDGFLARHFDWRSRLGAVLDPLADKLLMVSTYSTLGWIGLLPLWLVGLVLLRDGVIIGGALAYRRLCGEVEMAPTVISKANTVFQILLVMWIMAVAADVPLPQVGSIALIVLVTATTLLSGSHYVWAWAKRAQRCKAKERG